MNRCVWLCCYWLFFFVWALGIVAIVTKGMASGPAWFLLAGLEVAALVLSLMNVRGSVIDNRWSGLVLPLVYLAGILVSGRVLEGFGVWLFVAGCVCKFVALGSLRDRFTIACASWKGLADTGLYSHIRHPQCLGRLLIVAAVASSWASLLFLVGLVFVQIVVEESFLSRFEEYRDYRERVPAILIPGVL